MYIKGHGQQATGVRKSPLARICNPCLEVTGTDCALLHPGHLMPVAWSPTPLY